MFVAPSLLAVSLLFLIFCYLVFGFISSRTVTSTKDYFLAGRDLGIFPITFTLVATQLGGGMLLGTSQEAYSSGLFGILYTLGITCGFLLLGFGLAARLQSLNIATTAQLFETHYGSATLKKIASLLSVATLCGLLIAQIVASKSVITALGIQPEVPFLALWLFIIFYTMLGGLKTVIFMDICQVIFILVVFGAIFAYQLWAQPGIPLSIATLFAKHDAFGPVVFNNSMFSATLLMPALFALIEQDLAQRFFAARTMRVATISALLASLCITLFALIPIYLGMKAKLMGLALSTSQASPLVMIISATMNHYVLVAALCGIVAAITSTADSLLCAISSNLAQDFSFHLPGIKNKLTRSKVITLTVGLIALWASYRIPASVITILVSSYELSVSCLLIPLLFAYGRRSATKQAALGGIICGLAGFVIFRIWPIAFPKEIASLALSLLGFLIGDRVGCAWFRKNN